MRKCNWCDQLEERRLRFECNWIDEEGYTASFEDPDAHIVATCIAKYCPVCGRKLREEKDHDK